MDLPAALEWYVQLAKTPGWKEYVWHRVNEMAQQHPSEFRDLPDLLTKEMKRENRPDSDHRARETTAGEGGHH